MLTSSNPRFVPGALLAALAFSPFPLAAQQPPVIPVEHFFDSPEIAGARIAPDGRWLAYLKPWRGKLNLFVRPLEGDTSMAAERRLTADTLRPIFEYYWSADGRKLLYLQDQGGNENYHVFAVNVDGRPEDARDLTPYDSVRAFMGDIPHDLPDRVFIALNKRDRSAFDAYWLDLETGRLELAAENPGRFGQFLIDREHRVRVGLAEGPAGEREIHVRSGAAGPWRRLKSYPATESAVGLRMHPDGRHLYLLLNHDTDLVRLVSLDLETGAERVVHEDPEREVDLEEVLFGESTDSVLWTAYNADTVRIYGTTKAVAADLDRIRRLHAGTPRVSSMTRDERRWVVAFDAPTDPGVTYLYDRDTGRGRFLFRPRPWLKPERLADMTPVEFTARDGLTIRGYLTTPKGLARRNLPLVLLVHGGPWARDYWGWDPEAQLLANRGYAVLQVNYRGSTGYGKRFYNAAVRAFAGAMHHDLIDGVDWLVKQGTVDRRRICIYGGSYGGYATLVGVTFTPGKFACGVDYVGPSSLITLVESFPPYWRPFLEATWYRFVGDPAKPDDRKDMWARSPLSRIDRIRTPLLIVQGANDPRVTKRESDQLAIALRDRGVKVQYLLAANEGHGFVNPENRLALYHAMDRFFARYLRGRTQSRVPPEVERRIREMTVEVDTLKLAAAAGV